MQSSCRGTPHSGGARAGVPCSGKSLSRLRLQLPHLPQQRLRRSRVLGLNLPRSSCRSNHSRVVLLFWAGMGIVTHSPIANF